jgi:transcriptional regulator with XRE-family HTH domain
MIEARMSPDELIAHRLASGLSRSALARKLNVSHAELSNMEAGEEPIPARFDDDVYSVIDDITYDLTDPSPGAFS